VALVCKAADEIRITFVPKFFGAKRINEIVLTTHKLTISADWLQVVSGRMWPAGQQFTTYDRPIDIFRADAPK
jgi:hypothetical protein